MASTNLPDALTEVWRDLIARAGGDPSLAKALIHLGTFATSESKDPVWLSRLPSERQEEWRAITNPERRQEWLEARRLELALQDDLSPKVLTSISHTRTNRQGARELAVIAVGFGASTPIRGVGVDLELATRSIDPRLKSRLLLPQEECLGLDLLDAWVIKEACFKSVPGNESTVLTDFCVTHWDSSARRGQAMAPARLGAAVCSFAVLRQGEWVIGLAASNFASG